MGTGLSVSRCLDTEAILRPWVNEPRFDGCVLSATTKKSAQDVFVFVFKLILIFININLNMEQSEAVKNRFLMFH